MALMLKGNCEKQVPEDKVSEFLELGYSLINEEGKILKVGDPQKREDLKVVNATLKRELEKVVAENHTLAETNEALKAEVEKLTAALAEANEALKAEADTKQSKSDGGKNKKS